MNAETVRTVEIREPDNAVRVAAVGRTEQDVALADTIDAVGLGIDRVENDADKIVVIQNSCGRNGTARRIGRIDLVDAESVDSVQGWKGR